MRSRRTVIAVSLAAAGAAGAALAQGVDLQDYKQVERGRTRTTITPLDDSDRVDELAAMLRGDSAAEGTRQEAIAMLEEAQALR